jgi:hypothetical protein
MTRVVVGSFESGASAVTIPAAALKRASAELDADRRRQQEEAARAASLRVRTSKRARLVGRLRRSLAALTKGGLR